MHGKHNIASKTRTRFLTALGGTGIGKSALLQHFADNRGIGYICRDLSLMEPCDLVGMPKLEKGRTHFLPPVFLPDEGEGILVLEEINRAPEYMRAPCLQLLTDLSLNDYRLPPGWLPVAAINPAEDGYDAAELDPALLSRFVQLTVVPSRRDWLVWARGNGIHNQVVGYVESDPGVFGSTLSNPPSWTYVSDLLHAGQKIGTDRSLLRAAVAGCVGPERCASFFSFVQSGVAPLAAESILSAYRSQRQRVLAWIGDGKLDLVKGTLLNVKKQLQASTEFDKIRRNPATWKSLGQFVGDLPGDLRHDFENFASERNYEMPPSGATKGRSKP